MNTAAEKLNRRIGRMEALTSDLAELKPGYQATELEVLRARELQAALARVFEADPGPPQQAAPAPEGPESETKAQKPKK